MRIEKDSRTWVAVEEFIAREKADAVQYLIADRDSEQQRGALKVLERLEAYANQSDEENRWELV